MNMGIVAGLIKALAPGVDPQVIEQAVTDWLNDHPEATTTVEDGSITEAKLAQDVLAELGEIEELKEAIAEQSSPVENHFAFESGSFNSTTGAKSSNDDRARLKDFVPEHIDKLDASQIESGALVYAWDSNGDYVGFWGGSGWVKSGSQYLQSVNFTTLRTTYTGYKFKVVVSGSNIGTNPTNVSNKMIFINDTGFTKRISDLEKQTGNLNTIPEYVNGGYSVSTSDGTMTPTTSNARVRTTGNIPSSVRTIACMDGYAFFLYAMDENGKSYGSYRESESFERSGTSKKLKQFDVSKYDYAGYRIVMMKADATSNITPDEAERNLLLLPFQTEDDSSANSSADIFGNVDKNMCLCGIKTDIADDKIPYHRGFLFHKLSSADQNKLWYANSLGGMEEIGTFYTDPRYLRFAISPKDGTIIATMENDREGIWVKNSQTGVRLHSFETNPSSWLYNSGVDFINDGDDEYCVFAEYNGSGTLGTDFVFNVWRGKHPYTSASDWEIVFSQPHTSEGIGHFHMVRRDPWTDILYLTSGDDDANCKWWYSTDAGENWTLLASGSESGYSNQILRCINFIFTEDYVYWATDSGTNHCLYKASRGSGGIIDPTTKSKVCDLPSGYATNSLCYVESPKGLFMYDRVDKGFDAQYGDPVTLKFYDLSSSTLKDVVTIPLAENTWGGCRGKCYVNYTNSRQPFPAMGFAYSERCIFDIVADNLDNIGTIIFDPACGRFYTANLN